MEHESRFGLRKIAGLDVTRSAAACGARDSASALSELSLKPAQILGLRGCATNHGQT